MCWSMMQQADLVEAAAGGHELSDDVLAHAVLFEHAVDAADLALDAAQPREDRLDVVLGWSSVTWFVPALTYPSGV